MTLLPTAPPADVRESHASRVLLHGDRAYKIKKPVRFPFLDQSSAERRHLLCRAEVELNRELAPDLYLAVRGLVPADGDGRLRLAGEDDPDAVDYAVEMRRFDEHATLAALIRAGTLHDEQLDAVAERLAAFHASARRAKAPADPAAALAAALARLDRNAEQLLALLPNPAQRARVVAQLRCAATFATARSDELAARAAAGCIRELHGDLRAEHVLPGPPVRIVDRLEFDAELRTVDVGDEVGFLAMDLAALGASHAARRFIAAYRAAGGDPGDDAFVAWHMLHRAQVRAKVAILSTQAADAPAPVPPPAAAALLDLADRCAWRLRLPPVLVVCGPAASGKSTLAAELARRTGRAVIAADVVRKRLAGLAPTERARAEHYTPEMSRRTYRELGLLAAAEARHDGVIVDATFRHRADRDAFHAALGDAPLFVECVVPPAVLAERAVHRLSDPERISDATAPLALGQLRGWEPLDEVPPARHHLLRADRPASEVADVLAAVLDGTLIA
jgi:aminoglycoside phosphotransferase family enzyme/predicted kinase